MQPKKRSPNSEYVMDCTIRCSIPDSGKIFHFSKNVQTSSGAHPASYSTVLGLFPRG
jgi:hypothetical protein